LGDGVFGLRTERAVRKFSDRRAQDFTGLDNVGAAVLQLAIEKGAFRAEILAIIRHNASQGGVGAGGVVVLDASAQQLI